MCQAEFTSFQHLISADILLRNFLDNVRIDRELGGKFILVSKAGIKGLLLVPSLTQKASTEQKYLHCRFYSLLVQTLAGRGADGARNARKTVTLVDVNYLEHPISSSCAAPGTTTALGIIPNRE